MVSALDLQYGSLGFKSCSGHLLDFFFVVTQSQILSHACLIVANWMPFTSWDFLYCYVVFELFVSNYFSGGPVN